MEMDTPKQTFFGILLTIFLQECLATEQLMCVACGFPKVSPDNDVYGSYGLELGMKRYNHSCEEYDSLGEPEPDPFLRICPLGVKSCFYITGKYGNQELVFRGCAEAMYEHDFGCDSDLQAVDVIDQRGATKQVDVDINICFCSSQTCNVLISGGQRPESISFVIILALAAFTVMNFS